jgi:hypothetical protein
MGKVAIRAQWVMLAAGVLLSPVLALFLAWFLGWPRVRRLWPLREAGPGGSASESSRSPAGERIRSFTSSRRSRTNCDAELHRHARSVTTGCMAGMAGRRATLRHLKAMLAPYPSDEMICWPMSARVGNVKNNDPSWSKRLIFP